MGKGIDMARTDAPVHAAVMDDFKDQLVIVLMKRLRKLGDPLAFPVAELDDTGQDMLSLRIDESKVFHFELNKKS